MKTILSVSSLVNFHDEGVDLTVLVYFVEMDLLLSIAQSL